MEFAEDLADATAMETTPIIGGEIIEKKEPDNSAILPALLTAVESAWIGRSEATARSHYIHVLDEEYERAAGKAVEKLVEKDNKKWAKIG